MPENCHRLKSLISSEPIILNRFTQINFEDGRNIYHLGSVKTADFWSKQPDMRLKMADDKATDFKVDRPVDGVHRGRSLV